ncbi:protein MIZU-KUSSEI 1 [Silene latifolia]|uniref:protein MIZU-KUSSEI 1 n=1 Tax=Silene latifolia TaxID=37657 RepID=UPI003D775C93
MKQHQLLSLNRNSSTNSNSNIIPSNFTTSSSFPPPPPDSPRHHNSSSSNTLALSNVKKTRLSLSSFVRSLLHVFSFSTSSWGSAIPSCRWLTIPSRALSISSPAPLGRKVTGTLFGHRKGHVTFAVQDHPKGGPVFLIELALSTSALVKEMSSGLVRIALECERAPHAPKLFSEPVWSMYCNGKKCGYATSRPCTEFDCYVLRTIQSVSVGAGVIPLVENTGSGSEGELLYMRAKFERVVGNRDSEAFYMLNPDGNGGPELSIFLLRL